MIKVEVKQWEVQVILLILAFNVTSGEVKQ